MKSIHQDIAIASTLDGEFYTSETIFKLTIENVFARSWLYILDEDDVKENNFAFPFNYLNELLPEPLFLINTNACDGWGSV